MLIKLILISFVCNAFRMPRISEELRHHVIIKMKEEANQKKVARYVHIYSSEDLAEVFEDQDCF